MTELTIKTNHQPRELKYIFDFTEAEQKEIRNQYDWMNSGDLECNFGFFKYRGMYHHLQDFLKCSDTQNDELRKWDGYSNDSYFSGLVIKLCEDNESVIVGTYYS